MSSEWRNGQFYHDIDEILAVGTFVRHTLPPTDEVYGYPVAVTQRERIHQQFRGLDGLWHPMRLANDADASERDEQLAKPFRSRSVSADADGNIICTIDDDDDLYEAEA